MDKIIEGDFCAYFTNENELLDAVFKLRHKIFVEYLKWIPSDPSMKETDNYDKYAIHLVAKAPENKVVGYLRVIRGGEGIFMLQNDFSMLNPFGNEINQPVAIEISRFCIEPSLSFLEKRLIAMLLYKTCYLWSLEQHLLIWHIVVTHRYFRVLRKEGFPFEMVSETDKFSPKFRTIHARLFLPTAQSHLSKLFPNKFNWISKYSSDGNLLMFQIPQIIHTPGKATNAITTNNA
jgi:acyl homoserine lactone synthase